MSDARTYPKLPALFYTIDRGDTSLLTPQIESLFNGFSGRSPMANAMNCSAGWSTERKVTTAGQTKDALFSNINLAWAEQICKAVDVPNGMGAASRLSSDVPALFISGTLDTNTPPFQAEEVRWGFPNSTHLIVENGGHETLPSKAVQEVVADFFKGTDVRGRSVIFDTPKFVSVESLSSHNGTK